MTPRDGSLAGGLVGLAAAFVLVETDHLGSWGVVGMMLGGMALGAAAAGARRPADFGQALFLPAPKR